MVFSSLIFLFVFLPIFLFFYFIKKDLKYKNIILLIFSLFFYAWGEPVYIILMLLSITFNFVLSKAIDKNKSKSLFILSIILNLGLLGVFKYADFFIVSINDIFNFSIPLTGLKLPIGISFYTFQILTYVIDAYKGSVPVQKSWIKLGCYISAFPQLIAGPIVRYSDVNDALVDRSVDISDVSYGIKRFILGLGKKILIANQVAYVADTIFNNFTPSFGFIGIFIGITAYTLQIYFDFSGYSDMAIGLGRIMGFKYLENFNYPYIAKSVTDFWRRWHMSLSSFFKDYVYIPLGGNKVKTAKHIRNIFIVWTLTGLWHGASWTFVLWGVYYGILLIVEKYILKDTLKKLPNFFQHLYTILIFMFGWLIFRAETLDTFNVLLASLFGSNGLGDLSFIKYLGIFQVKYIFAIILGIIFSTPLYDKLQKSIKNSWLWNIIILTIFLLSIWFILVNTYNPFIYFRF